MDISELTPYWEERSYSQGERDKMAKSGEALPDGSYPIANATDLASAIKLVGNGKASNATVKAHIIKRAKALGLTAKLPDGWTQQRSSNRRKAVQRGREVRMLDSNVELRSETDDDGKVTLRGMVIRYGVPYSVRDAYGTFTETIERGAAAQVVAGDPDVRFLFNHDGLPLARTTNGSLRLTDTPEGLEVEARLNPEMPAAKDVITAVSDGLLSQMSVGMNVGTDAWNDEMDHRSISRLSGIPDCSVVTYPASPTTSIEAVRSELSTNPELRAQLEADMLPTARLDHIEAELRAGKTLSSANAAVLVNMAKTMHDLLASGGADFAHSPDDAGGDEEQDGAPEFEQMEDGTEPVSTETDPDARAAELEVELRKLKLEQALAEQRQLELSIR
jgi:HK97 family phage prohead protease